MLYPADGLPAGVLPYIELPSLGPVHVFGLIAALGMTVAGAAGLRHAERLGLDLDRTRRMALHCVIGVLVGEHYIDLLAYQPGWYDRPDALWIFLNPFAGISSFGGIIGGAIGFWIFARKERGKRLRYGEVAMYAGLVFLTFGRAGCASVHDHIGVATRFPLAVDFPRIGPHHDLGLYEFALLALVLLPVSALLLRTPRRAGLYLGVMTIAYAVPRFYFDSLRRELDNPHYLGLTPGQWGCLATIAIGIALLVTAYRRPAPETPAAYLTPHSWRFHLFGRRPS